MTSVDADLTREVEKSRELELERARLLEAEHEAAARAAAAHEHLGRLQRVTSALSEAVAVFDVCGVLHADIADAVGARRTCLALAREEGRPLSLIGDGVQAIGTESSDRADERTDPTLLLEAAYAGGTALWPRPPSLLVALPLALGSRRIGAVLFELHQPRELTPADRALFEDVTRQLALALDRARMYELANQERARAEEANQAKDEFLAMLGHELRNPLAPMLTAITLMRSRLGEVALKERSIIERQLNHMVRLVDDLLDISRITRGSLKLSRKPVELYEVVRRAVEMASPMLDERGHQLTVSVPRAGVRVEVDTYRIAQAVAHLLMNAAKYTPNGGCVEVSAALRGSEVVLSVLDDGIGLDSTLLGRVFEPFVQRQQALDRSKGGLGLGLTIARRLVELHGGQVTASSPGVGGGSTFNIELSLAGPPSERSALPGPRDCTPISWSCPASEARSTVSQAQAESAAHASSLTRGVRVLVVDDNVDAAEMLGEALRISGHVVCIAHDGPTALSLVDDFRPELALLDIGLPVMDGFDLAKRLRARLNGDAPMFVAVTGYGQPADRARTKQVGFDEHLVKPVDLARLNAIVRRAARRSAPS